MTKTFEVIKKQNGGLISLARFCGARSARQRRSSQIIHGTVVLCTRCLAVRAEVYIFLSSKLQRRARRRATINVVDVSDNVATCQNVRTHTYVPSTVQNMYGTYVKLPR